MPTITTIGFGKKGAERLVQLLVQAGVSTVIDTRRRPDSPLSGYARQRDLPFILATADIGYEHRLELAPANELLDRYRTDKDWPAYEKDFRALVLETPAAQSAMTELLERSRDEVVALLCSEPTPERCHRRLVADCMRQMDPSLQIVHLT